MATRLFLRSTTANTAGYLTSEKSAALPVGSLNDTPSAKDLSVISGATQQATLANTLAQTAHQDSYLGKFISEPLLVSSITAATWTIAVATSEGNTNSNQFTVCSLYVLTSGDTVRGFIYDSDTPRGVEYSTLVDGQVLTVSGAAVSSVVNTDRLCFEFWAHGAQSMATSYQVALLFNGATPVIDTTNADAGSYIQTPQDLFVAPAGAQAPKPVVFPSLAVQQGLRW